VPVPEHSQHVGSRNSSSSSSLPPDAVGRDHGDSLCFRPGQAMGDSPTCLRTALYGVILKSPGTCLVVSTLTRNSSHLYPPLCPLMTSVASLALSVTRGRDGSSIALTPATQNANPNLIVVAPINLPPHVEINAPDLHHHLSPPSPLSQLSRPTTEAGRAAAPGSHGHTPRDPSHRVSVCLRRVGMIAEHLERQDSIPR
jgi:hypothetical protein